MICTLNSSRFPDCQYEKTGEGFPVMLVHGFAEDSRIWKYQRELLQAEFTLLIPDLPGSGSSPLPDEEMSMELLADFLHEILQQEGFERVILLGHSMGGYTAMAFAERHGARLEAFGLLHSSAYADDDTKKENRRKSIRLIEREGREVFLKAMVPNLYSENSKKELQDEIAFHLTLAMGIASESLTAYYRAMIARPDRRHLLLHTNVPVLFVIGKEDTAIPEQDMIAQSSLPQTSHVELLSSTGHMGMLEEHEKLNSMVFKFCKYVLESKN